MSISEASSTLRRVMNDCAYDFGSTSYQDRCEGISVDYSGSTIYVTVSMYVVDRCYKEEVYDNISSTVRSICSQYGIPYGINLKVNYSFKY